MEKQCGFWGKVGFGWLDLFEAEVSVGDTVRGHNERMMCTSGGSSPVSDVAREDWKKES